MKKAPVAPFSFILMMYWMMNGTMMYNMVMVTYGMVVAYGVVHRGMMGLRCHRHSGYSK